MRKWTQQMLEGKLVLREHEPARDISPSCFFLTLLNCYHFRQDLSPTSTSTKLRRNLCITRLCNILCIVMNTFFHIHDRWQSTHSINLGPDTLHQTLGFLLVSQNMLEGKEGTIIAMTMNPATDDIDLIHFSFADDVGRLPQICCVLQ